jgi:opacity protein-like surface antigen
MKTSWIVLLLLLMSAFSFAQIPSAPLSTATADIYVGYLATFPDYGAQFDSYRFNGAEVSYTKPFTPHLGMVVSGDMVFGSVYSAKQFSLTVGPKYNLLTGRFRPYLTGQAGFAYQSSNGMYAGDHHPPLKPGASDTEDGFSYRLGAGVDIQLSHKIYWRALQWDIQPQPWGRHTPWYTNVGSGIGFSF